MDFSRKEEHQLLAETARRVGERFGLDYWLERDRHKEFAEAFWQAVCDAGLCGVALPRSTAAPASACRRWRSSSRIWPPPAEASTVGQLFMNNPIFGGISIGKFGTPQMKRDWLPKLVRGEMRFAMALTEPDAGTNTLAMTTFAARHGDVWRINGSKIWITCVPQSQKMLVVARTTKFDERPKRTHGISMFLIDTDRKGLTHQAIEKLGTHTNPRASSTSRTSRRAPTSSSARSTSAGASCSKC